MQIFFVNFGTMMLKVKKPTKRLFCVLRSKTKKVFIILKKAYPNARIALNFSTNFELLVATMLSAQCTDKRVNLVTHSLFKRYRSITEWADAKIEVMQEDIHSVGFFRNKAKNIINAAIIIRDKFNGRVPESMADLISLPGIARKSANVILYNAFSKNEGIAVDTHVRRLALRLGFTQSNNPIVIEKDLMQLVLRKDWGQVNYLLVEHGRAVCRARSPLCVECGLTKYCYYNQKIKNERV